MNDETKEPTAQLAAQLGVQAKTILVMRSLAGGKYRGVAPLKHRNRLYWPIDTAKRIQAAKDAKRVV